MKTIYYQFLENYPADRMNIVGETEKSYVLGFADIPNSENEICATKSDEGKKWFWTKEEADSTFKAEKIESLKKQLEELEKN